MDNQIQSFLDVNQKGLMEIYSKEREERGEGILQISKNEEKQNMDVVYLEFTRLPKELINDINKRKETTKKTNIIFFFVVNNDKSTLLQIELQ